MLHLLTGVISRLRQTVRSVVEVLGGLDEHESAAFERFMRRPTSENLDTVATYASVEYQIVEDFFEALPDLLAWKDDGTWHLAAPS